MALDGITLSRDELIARARLKKAFALVDTLRESGITAELAAMADEHWWKMAAEKAGVNVPSTETQAIVLRLMREREEQSA